MQDKVESTKVHELKMVKGKCMTMTAVKSVPSFDNNEILVVLDDSKLRIEGNNLEIDKLDIENETLSITGDVTSLSYGKGDLKHGIIRKIFK